MENQKNKKIIKAELMGLIGTLREKQLYCLNEHNYKQFETVFNSLSKDPNYKDASDLSEGAVISTMLFHPLCPKTVVDGALSLPYFEGQEQAYKSSHCSSDLISSVLKKTIAKIKLTHKRNELTQSALDILSNIAKNPNLTRADRFTLEKACDVLSNKHYDDCLVASCVEYTERDSWLCEKFATFVRSGGGNLSVLMSFIKNPLAKDHMLDYAAKNLINLEWLELIVKHPNISANSLAYIQKRFNDPKRPQHAKVQTFINNRISALNDDDLE